MIDHLTIDRGRIVTAWPDENDTDQHYGNDGNPIALLWFVALIGALGFLMWAPL